MRTTDSMELLRCYVREQSEVAFAALVEQHVALVYSTALRQVYGDDQAAQDVTQAVFTDLARKARRLTGHTSLTGWLYTSTRYLAAKARRTEQRRRHHEQEAHRMNQLLQPTGPQPDWNDLQPVLDDAMHELNAADREAVLLRFFEERPLAEIGAKLGLTENAARMRVQRALDKLHDALAKRGIQSTTTALAAVLASQVATAAPAGLANRVGRAAIAAGASGGVLATLVGMLAAAKVRLLVGATAVGIAAGYLVWPHPAARSPALGSSAGSDAMGRVAANSETQPAAATMALAADLVRPATGELAGNSNRLLLKIVTADSGVAVPNATLDYWIWGDGTNIHRKSLVSTRFGVCEVPVARDRVKQLILVSQSDGFADTRLEWRPDRGEEIPQEYTLRVARAVTIGGRVVDAENRPVSDAEVSFGNRTDPNSESRPQCDNFGWPFYVVTKSDAEGRWQIRRIAKEALRTVSGAASHPEHVRSQTDAAPAAENLLAGTYVFKLGRAIVVHGTVRDPDGQAVAGATVRVGYLSEVNTRQATTLEDGNFTIVGCKPGWNLLSAEADGFAATTMDVDLTDDSFPYTLTLQRGLVLRLRVVNQAGQPIPQAGVWLDSINQLSLNSSQTEPPKVQVEFNRKTDAEGRLEWNSAPDANLDFAVSASGYMRVSDVRVRPDGQELTVTMPPALTISGTVSDAETGRPIPRFRIVTGWRDWSRSSNTTNTLWSTIDRFWLSFDGGRFHHVYEEPVVGSQSEPCFVFKFEAEGYAPVVTRPVLASEGAIQFDVKLKAAPTTKVTVLQPDGQLAIGVHVGLAAPGAGLTLIPGGFSRANMQAPGILLTTDGQGRFSLPPDDGITGVLVAGATGFAEITPALLAADPTIHLQSWGRLEGRYDAGAVSAANHRLLFQYNDGNLRIITSDFTAYQVRTDDQGRFVFPRVPPGRHKLVELIPMAAEPGRERWMHRPLTEVEIRPGETSTIAIDASKLPARH